MKLVILLWILCLDKKTDCSVVRNFALQNEMSEQCRRRVISSKFLGRQVAGSSAEVMHFSRLELPYSCSISVRTESGSKIILVILSNSKESFIKSCKKEHDQLLVYEMGETFGGYWAALPRSVFQEEIQNKSTYYTLQTTETSNETTEIENTDNDDDIKYTEEIVSLTTPQDEIGQDYVVMEVPIVNVSGIIELGDTKVAHHNEEELFDLIYDVTPKNGVLYETSLMPLVQFSIRKQEQMPGSEDKELRYQLDYDVEFTPDYRLQFPTNVHRRKYFTRRYYSTKRLKFNKKNNELFHVNNNNNWSSSFYLQPEHVTELITPSRLNGGHRFNLTSMKNGTDTWQLVENYLNFINSNNLTTTPRTEDKETIALLKNISNIKHNSSVYLQSNLSQYSDFNSLTNVKNKMKTKKTNVLRVIDNYVTKYDNILSTFPMSVNVSTKSTNSSSFLGVNNTLSSKIKLDSSTKSTTSISKNYTREVKELTLENVITAKKNLGLPSTVTHYRQAIQLENVKTVLKESRRKSESGTLVGHESWENIVQVAPVIADILNVTTPLDPDNITLISKTDEENTTLVTKGNIVHRKKRGIQALSFDRHRPKQISTRGSNVMSYRSRNRFDSHQMAELIELQDDEIQGRVALHYYKNYVASAFFNMCDFYEARTKQVYLINSSRIVIAINNFTMDRITILMTESRVIHEANCPQSHLECQVSGVRVCVHQMNACDGIPNCGAYDIYDEDRLLCGSTIGFHYTVCLAACTFLMMLLTLLYSVHYWLKRCVPKVSQAFFVYTDKSENILYLDSIMRSPNDFDGGSHLFYRGSFFDDEDLSIDSTKDDNKKLSNILGRCFKFLLCRKPKRHYSEDKIRQGRLNRNFSFTEAELRKIDLRSTIDASIQTGDSLEMAHLQRMKKHSTVDPSAKLHIQLGKENLVYKKRRLTKTSDKELSTLRQLRDISMTLQSNSKNVSTTKLEPNVKKHSVPIQEEVELRSTLYDREGKGPVSGKHVLDKIEYEIHSEPPDHKKTTTKHLRFEEGATTIELLGSLNAGNIDGRHVVSLNTDRVTNLDFDTIENDEEMPSTSGRDFRRFWGAGKGNKNKKKAKLPLH